MSCSRHTEAKRQRVPRYEVEALAEELARHWITTCAQVGYSPPMESLWEQAKQKARAYLNGSIMSLPVRLG